MLPEMSPNDGEATPGVSGAATPEGGQIGFKASSEPGQIRLEVHDQGPGIPNDLAAVLIDADRAVADRYEAVTTPHAFVVDREGILRYRGAVDDVTFRQRRATRFFLEEAVEALLEQRLPEVQETPAYGCTIVREI